MRFSVGMTLFSLALAAAAPVEIPFATDSEEIRKLWLEGHRFELAGEFMKSSRLYEQIVERLPGESHPYWRLARNFYRFAKGLPMDDKRGRKHHFELTKRWASRGIDADPECAECFLYKFVGLSRLATTAGLFSSARHASEMAKLLDRAIELQPTFVDNDWNAELGNLYYAAGVFYRSVPNSAVLRWTIGVRGDLERSIDYLRKANEVTDLRIDYHVELGASLLCAATQMDDRERLAEGVEVLKRIPSLATLQTTDAIDREHAKIMIDAPKKACKYSREGWIEET